MGVRNLTTRCVEERIHIEIFFVRDNEPRLEVRDHCCDRLVFVSDVVLREFLNILVVNISNDSFDADCIQNGLECVFLTLHLVLLL